MKNRITLITLVAASLALLAGTAPAQDHMDRPGRESGGRRAQPQFRLDDRYHHDHYYPARGYVVRSLPAGSLSIAFVGGSYFFHAGVWYRPFGASFTVVAPPFGIIVPLLPPAYVPLMIGGASYYYANGVYYAPAPGSGYVVVAPPPGADSAQPAPVPGVPPTQAAQAATPAPIFYPRNGQSAEQTESDRQACNRWATTQPSAVADASVFQRAVAACMDGRGYTGR